MQKLQLKNFTIEETCKCYPACNLNIIRYSLAKVSAKIILIIPYHNYDKIMTLIFQYKHFCQGIAGRGISEQTSSH